MEERPLAKFYLQTFFPQMPDDNNSENNERKKQKEEDNLSLFSTDFQPWIDTEYRKDPIFGGDSVVHEPLWKRQFSPCVYDKEKKEWTSFSTTKSSNLSQLKIITWNLWFSTFAFQKRMKSELSILQNCDADIICLQELTSEFVSNLENSKWVQDNYYLAYSIHSTFKTYDTLILSKIPFSSSILYGMKTFMNRSVLIADFIVNEEKLRVATVHLESLQYNADIRALQLKTIFPLLKDSENVFLMGDMNFCSTWKIEQDNIESEYLDLWNQLHPNKFQGTIGMNYPDNRYEPAQFDRIFNRTKVWKPKSIEFLGTKAIQKELEESKQVFPSDHWGILGTYTYEKQ